MKKNKFLTILLAVAGVISLNSCNDYLEVESLSNTAEAQQFDSAADTFPLWSEYTTVLWVTIPMDRE